ncbi:MORC family CW-type zinc finger protein 3-like [Physella acuta]|uniref:MORC family CW-type zinc finger protein 3-like n=1 Tax=Physella acuta TaxID=109671 RepID=UPI0027DAEE38|nr:MORC family CW-type zinc finger protein 3-like [Physella acuta]
MAFVEHAVDGISMSLVHPRYLHSNSTSHTWAFSAVAELIDNAYDPEVGASRIDIDVTERGGQTCLTFLDNGVGMDIDKLYMLLSFGFCEKESYDRNNLRKPIGQYGNGFKSGTMRLGKDVIVFTRRRKTASVGFLSQTYLQAIEAKSVLVPLLEYELPGYTRKRNLDAIKQHSIFKTEEELLAELRNLESTVVGTKIIIYNLNKRLADGNLELDFVSDVHDINCPDSYMPEIKNDSQTTVVDNKYRHSLREYCSILYCRPRMKIHIRGEMVELKLMSKSLSQTETAWYKPSWLGSPVKITFGFSCEENTEDYGMLLYHRNRLIKAYERVGCQRKRNEEGKGVIGVAEVDFLTPTHNKQDFAMDDKYNTVMAVFATKLKDYWNKYKDQMSIIKRHQPDSVWNQCDTCLMWRRLPDGTQLDSLPKPWYCHMNPDEKYKYCFIEEELEKDDQIKGRKKRSGAKKANATPGNITTEPQPSTSANSEEITSLDDSLETIQPEPVEAELDSSPASPHDVTAAHNVTPRASPRIQNKRKRPASVDDQGASTSGPDETPRRKVKNESRTPEKVRSKIAIKNKFVNQNRSLRNRMIPMAMTTTKKKSPKGKAKMLKATPVKAASRDTELHRKVSLRSSSVPRGTIPRVTRTRALGQAESNKREGTSAVGRSESNVYPAINNLNHSESQSSTMKSFNHKDVQTYITGSDTDERMAIFANKVDLLLSLIIPEKYTSDVDKVEEMVDCLIKAYTESQEQISSS